MKKITTEITWFNPSDHPPPFDLLIWAVFAGQRTNDWGRTWETYTQVNSVKVLKTGACDEYNDTSDYDDFMAGDKTDFMDYQFNLEDYGSENMMDDWYSDAIVAWAYAPLAATQQMVEWHK